MDGDAGRGNPQHTFVESIVGREVSCGVGADANVGTTLMPNKASLQVKPRAPNRSVVNRELLKAGRRKRVRTGKRADSKSCRCAAGAKFETKGGSHGIVCGSGSNLAHGWDLASGSGLLLSEESGGTRGTPP